MKISVITACYNSAETIADTLKSVTEQSYSDIEYILIDGASTDNTLSIAEQYKNRITRIESGRDGGIYFALNKGLSLATGDIIAFLHADDVYAHKDVLAHVAAEFKRSGADSLYGDLNYVDRNDLSKVIRRWVSGSYSKNLFRKGWMPPHPSFFLRRTCYEKHGNFNTGFKTAADYELMLRMLHVKKVSVTYLPEVLVLMRTGGVSNASFGNRIRANREDRKAWQVNGIKPALLTLIRKPLSKLKQFF
ncbi:MAG: glycosyltransferase family 2 protein [Bacteroidota bacterium]|jgi:glycosyltransferase involved in cell wall biosynthesis